MSLRIEIIDKFALEPIEFTRVHQGFVTKQMTNTCARTILVKQIEDPAVYDFGEESACQLYGSRRPGFDVDVFYCASVYANIIAFVG
jgi:hypothetical protein